MTPKELEPPPWPELMKAAKRVVEVALEDRPEDWAEAVISLEAAIDNIEGK